MHKTLSLHIYDYSFSLVHILARHLLSSDYTTKGQLILALMCDARN
jgi:hypothetical protein